MFSWLVSLLFFFTGSQAAPVTTPAQGNASGTMNANAVDVQPTADDTAQADGKGTGGVP